MGERRGREKERERERERGKKRKKGGQPAVHVNLGSFASSPFEY